MQARWAQDKYERNTELCFVCNLQPNKNAELALIAKDVYNLYINGEFVQYGPARAAKGYAREERIPLDRYLTKEENTISVYVQANGTKTLCFALEKPLFAAEIWIENKLAYTTDDFRCYEMIDKLKRVERMSSQRGYLEVYEMAKTREPFDKSAFPLCKMIPEEMPKLLPRNVATATHKKALAKVMEKGFAGLDLTRVWENDFTRQLDTGNRLFSYTRAECDCVLSKELLAFTFDGDKDSGYRYQTYAFGRTHCGKFQIKIKVKQKTELWLAYDDILIDGKVKFNREQIIHGLKWTLEKGEYLLHSNEVYTAKYITLIQKGNAEVVEVAMLRVENPNAERLQFSCEDTILEEIVKASQHSFEHNGYDLLTDCPSRERAGYLCDGFFAARAEKFFCGENLVEKNLLENYALYEGEHFEHKGVFPMCYPSEPHGKDNFIPNWILWYILEIEDYAQRTGDKAFVSAQKQQILHILEYFQTKENEYGLLENLDGWIFVEWSRANDFVDGVNFPSNMCYYGALRAAANLLGDAELQNKANRLKETIIKWSYNGSFFVDNAVRENGLLKTTENVSETCQNYAAFFEIFTREEAPQFYNRLISELGCFHREKYHPDVHPSNMFIGYILRLCVLLREQENERVLEECKNRFADMARHTGTIWELFQTNASCNHGFGSIVGQMIVYALCGILGIDESEKKVYVLGKGYGTDCHVHLPLLDGNAEIQVNEGNRIIQFPIDYEVIIVG